jgi:hypothetical protein
MWRATWDHEVDTRSKLHRASLTSAVEPTVDNLTSHTFQGISECTTLPLLLLTMIIRAMTHAGKHTQQWTPPSNEDNATLYTLNWSRLANRPQVSLKMFKIFLPTTTLPPHSNPWTRTTHSSPHSITIKVPTSYLTSQPMRSALSNVLQPMIDIQSNSKPRLSLLFIFIFHDDVHVFQKYCYLQSNQVTCNSEQNLRHNEAK